MAFSLSDVDGTEPAFLPPSGQALLDIGASNIYNCTVEALTKFLRSRDVEITREIETWMSDYSYRSGFDEHGKRLNTAFFGELCTTVGIIYRAIDIFEGPTTIILDLNHDRLPDEYHGMFNVVANSGTTEHVMNQFNAFEVIHDATAVGGEMFHILPVAGHADHGYVHYTGRFFFDLAGYNGYEILETNFNSDGTSQLFDSVRNYATIFPILGDTLKKGVRIALGGDKSDLALRDTSVRIKYRKIFGKRFVGALDSATAVSRPINNVMVHYDRNVEQPRTRDTRARS
jgi:hypothetical protein